MLVLMLDACGCHSFLGAGIGMNSREAVKSGGGCVGLPIAMPIAIVPMLLSMESGVCVLTVNVRTGDKSFLKSPGLSIGDAGLSRIGM